MFKTDQNRRESVKKFHYCSLEISVHKTLRDKGTEDSLRKHLKLLSDSRHKWLKSDPPMRLDWVFKVKKVHFLCTQFIQLIAGDSAHLVSVSPLSPSWFDSQSGLQKPSLSALTAHVALIHTAFWEFTFL